MRTLIQKKIPVILALLMLVSFFSLYARGGSSAQQFVSPDETANFVFSKQFATTSFPALPAPLNDEFATDFFHPRSTIVRAIGDQGAHVVPASFLGFSLIVGSFGKIVGMQYASLLVPLLSVLSVCFFYGIIKRFFDKKTALTSAFLLLIHPAFWYFSSRAYMHNALFLGLLVIGLYFFVLVAREENESANRWLWAACGGFFIGLSLSVRVSELIWVSVVFMVLASMRLHRARVVPLMVSVFFMCLALAPMLYFNHHLYGGALRFGGYSDDVATISGADNQAATVGSTVAAFVFPFGVDVVRAFNVFWKFAMLQFWWIAAPACIGYLMLFVTALRKRTDWARIGYLALWAVVALYLIVYYGSWVFYDHPDPYAITVGTSYVRYWLPLFVFSIPFASYFFIVLYNALRTQLGVFAKAVFLFIAFAMFVSSLRVVFFNPYDGLEHMRGITQTYEQKMAIVKRSVPEDAIMITGRTDKVFFPEYNVILDLEQERVLDRLPDIVGAHPVYYFSAMNLYKTNALNDTVLKPRGITFGRTIRLDDQESLIEIISYDGR